MQNFENTEEITFRKKIKEILTLFEDAVLDLTLKDFKQLPEKIEMNTWDEIYQTGITEDVPSIMNTLNFLMSTNIDRDELLKEAHMKIF